MIMIFKFDSEYNYIPGAEIFLEEGDAIPESFTDIRPIDGFYKAKFNPDKQVWYESATQEYIDSLQPLPSKPSDIELLGQTISTMKINTLKYNQKLITLEKEVSMLKSGGSS
ncbi:hypothetical protein [Bacillus atrophaeus]|uniref:hypothetical protein n=1 Tax=Bacillus atrophaeus TaxID=1452 RepID=UPI0022808FA7|nr:hypothetical protein [Bacillus atrophaeus]MCY8513843.1 hypothetical protein [Bacillus atrophaeus]MCY8990687.1 hypothetical protein [Bacillus atrophaeus]